MSSSRNLRKRIHFTKSVETVPQKVNTETTSFENKTDNLIHDPSLEVPNGKILYPCQYCSKTFPQKLSSISHMSKCPKRIEKQLVLNENKSKINNNDVDVTGACVNENLHNGCDSDENKCSESEKKITENATKNDVSIYDYNEPDDISEDTDLNEDSEETLNNRQCKHCNTLFENPLDLLRHSRDCHNFPRKILSLDEIEKYFDYPNRQYCPICEKPIKTRNFRSVFIKHLLVHTTGLTHECTVCKKKFRRRDHMRAHERRHIVAV